MAAGRNKALLELAGGPMLLHSVDTFRAICERLVVVSAASDMGAVRLLAGDAVVVEGGATRHSSERSALQALRDQLAAGAVAAIHDAARPLVTGADVEAVFAAAEKQGAAMLAVPSEAPLVEVAEGRVRRAYPAGDVWRAQTPQAARGEWLLQAYDRAAAERFEGTDTAAVLAFAGFRVRVVAATAPNPKITVPEDLAEAERLLTAARPARGPSSTPGES
jgi:2-C-methyl-D-erythritol 4-phosphate cytidylyltransferase